MIKAVYYSHVYVCARAHVLIHVWLFATLRTVAGYAPLSVGLFMQEYCGGLPFSTPGDLLDPGIKPASPALAGGFFTCLLGSSVTATCIHKIRRINVNNSNSFQKHIGILVSRCRHSRVNMCMHELIHVHKTVLSNCTENYKHFR